MALNKEVFQTDILIQVSDINYGGHLGNDRFLAIAQEARVRWLRSNGWSELNIGDSSAGLIVTEAHIQFLKEAFLGQTLHVAITVMEYSLCTMTLFYQLIEKETQKCIGKITTKVAFFDYQKRKIVKVPTAFVDLINPN